MKILVYSLMEMEKPCYTELEEELGIELKFCTENPSVENAALAKGAEAVSVVTSPITGEILQALHDNGVRYVSTRNIGYDHIDIAQAKKIGIGVGNSSYQPESVAEYTLMLMLMCARKAEPIRKAYEKQDYTLAGKMGFLLHGSTVGVIGTGKIGFAVIRLLSAFGCRILAFDPYPNEAVRAYAEYVDLDTLLEQSNLITLHAPATADNYHLLDREAISKMKDGVVIVNAARGTLIDSDALAEGLEGGKIGAAGLDVLEGEGPVYYRNFEGQPVPLASIERLSKLPNVVLTPHTAFYTRNAIMEMVRNSIRSCAAELKGEPNPWRIV